MSGIEVAGLILGAFPLILSALAKHQEAATIFGDWWDVKRSYKECFLHVGVERKYFEKNIKDLLGPILYEDDDLDELLNNPSGERWQSESLSASIIDLLPTSYEHYMGIIVEFHTIMLSLGKELGLEKHCFQSRIAQDAQSSKGQSDLRETIDFEWQRAKFALNRKRRAALVAGLTTCNSYLDKITASNDVSGSAVQFGTNPRIAMPLSLNRFWQFARELYTLIQQAWSCPCCKSHGTDLLLRYHKDPRKVEFKVLFTYAEKLTCQHSGSWDWKEASITALEDPAPQPRVTHDKAMLRAIAGGVPPPSSAVRPSSKTQRSRKPKGVTFLDNIIPPANVTALLPLQVNPVLPEISDLCASLTNTAPDDNELGLLTGKSAKYSVYIPEQKPFLKSGLEYVTLDDALRKKGQWSLNRRQRYSIALALASAYVQLHASPWIRENWDQHDVYLLRDSNTSEYYEQPRLSRNVLSQPPSSAGQIDRSLVKLGIMLLELAFGEVLEENVFRQKIPTINNQSNLLLDKAAAEEWCVCCTRDEHPHFEDPVLWCLHHPTTRTKMDPDDDTWRKNLFQNVVHPLAICCKANNFGVLER